MKLRVKAITMYVVEDEHGQAKSEAFKTPEEATRDFLEDRLIVYYRENGINCQDPYNWANSILDNFDEIKKIMDTEEAPVDRVERKIEV